MTTERKKPVNLSRMSKSKVKESLAQIPIDILLAGTDRKSTLTKKQKDFAYHVAIGETKADAYRKSYNVKTKNSRVIGNAGSALAKHSGIAIETQAIKEALQAMEYQNATQLKALVVHQLTKHALDEDIPPAQRIKALELLGKTHEVGLFLERKEITTINSSGDIKAKLLDQLKDFIKADAIDVVDDSADSLLAELAGDAVPRVDSSQDALPVSPTPNIGRVDHGATTHSNLLNQSSHLLNQSQVMLNQSTIKKYNQPSQVIDSIEEKNLTLNVSSEKGVGGHKNIIEDASISIENTPPIDLDSESGGVYIFGENE